VIAAQRPARHYNSAAGEALLVLATRGMRGQGGSGPAVLPRRVARIRLDAPRSVHRILRPYVHHDRTRVAGNEVAGNPVV